MVVEHYGSRSKTSRGQTKFSMVMPPDLLEQLDALAGRKRTKRSTVLRQVIELGLRAQERIDTLAAEVA
jgi:metal-responsive CopG/Arc/MetJ family transcriptional regulator